MAATDLHVNITWDTEPTEGAKALIQLEVHNVLQKTFQESSWFAELVRTEVRKAMNEEARLLGKEMQHGRFLD